MILKNISCNVIIILLVYSINHVSFFFCILNIEFDFLRIIVLDLAKSHYLDNQTLIHCDLAAIPYIIIILYIFFYLFIFKVLFIQKKLYKLSFELNETNKINKFLCAYALN